MARRAPPPPPPPHRIQVQLPWERTERESDEAWQAFLEYRDMGLSRSSQRVADIIGKSLSHVHTYCFRHRWRERVVAYERHLDAHRQDEHEKAVRDMARRHALVANMMLARSAEVIKKAKLEDISLRDAIAMFRAAVPAERQGRAAEQAYLPKDGLTHLDAPADPEAMPDDDWPAAPQAS